MEEYIQKFRKELRLRWFSYSSMVTYESCIKSFLYHFNKDPKSMTVDDIKDYLLQFDNRSTHKHNNAAIHKFYETVIKQPLSLKDLPFPKKTHFLPNILSPEEVLMICRSISLLKQRVAIQTTYSCGLRISEIINLKIEDINFYDSVLKVVGSKGAKDRYIPIPSGTLRLIQKYIEKDNPKVYLLNGWLNEPQYSKASISSVLRDALIKCGIKRRIRMHDLRHSRLSHLADKCVSFNYIKDFAGHSDYRTTLTYTHTSVDAMKQQIAIADSMIASKIQNDSKKPSLRH